MGEKIKSNKKKNIFVWILIISMLIYTRFINLDWGLPYPMHPDERNMAVAVATLNCKLPAITYDFPKTLMGEWKPMTTWLKISGEFNVKECFNPHFFAYGQFPLYLGYIFAFIIKFLQGSLGIPINLQEAIISLRFISAFASMATALVVFNIVNLINKNKNIFSYLITALIIIFSPYAVQFSHFGTTESLLMFFYSLIIYLSLLFLEKKASPLFYVFNCSLILGLSLATKVSSMIFMTVPLMPLFFKKNHGFPFFYYLLTKFFDLLVLSLMTFLFFFLFSPHNFINWKDFLSALIYESNVATGKIVVFYTRQFIDTVPFWFQLTKIFPYALGVGVTVVGLISFLGLNLKDKKINLLRLFFLIYFIPTSLIFAKWIRFMAPIFPILTVFSILLVQNLISRLNIKLRHVLIMILILILVFPGIKFINIYLQPDVRFQATEWINKNIPKNSYVLSETANVVDIPLSNDNNLTVVSFNFYDLDQNPIFQEELEKHLQKADYIFIPSRRIFANLKEQYPKLERYYQDLFSGKMGFEKAAEFSSGLNDEQAEETWTVFDHPVIRVYKRIRTS